MEDLYLEHSLIGYIDILGYQNFIYDKIMSSQLHMIINETFEIASNSKSYTFSTTIRLKMFSDNIIFVADLNSNLSDVLKDLIFVLASIQFSVLQKSGVLLRGVITEGDIYINENYVFGTGLVEAYIAESNNSFPRITIDNNLIGNMRTSQYYDNFIKQDGDDMFFINYLAFFTSTDFMYTDQDKFDLAQNIITITTTSCNSILSLGKFKYDAYYNVLNKYLWTIEYFNGVNINMEESKKLTIDYSIIYDHSKLVPTIQFE